MTAIPSPSSPSSTRYFEAAPAQVWCDTGSELLLLHVPSGIYYGLNPTGEQIWRLLQEPRTVAELRDALLAAYEVEPARCEAALLLLIEHLTAAGLLRVVDTRAAAGPMPPPAAGGQRTRFTEPRLLRFGDRASCLLWWVGMENLAGGRPAEPAREAGAAGEPHALAVNAAAPAEREPGPGEEESALALLVCCARVELTGDDVARLRASAATVTNWRRIGEVAERHGMLPLLYWHLQRSSSDLVPAPVLRTLRRDFMRNAILTLALAGELQQICADFGDHGILAVPYKGPVLGAAVYGNVALRRRGDLDLLLHRQDVPRGREVLLRRGYAMRYELSAGAAEHLLRARYHEIFDRRPPHVVTVELHWAFTSRDLGVRLDLASLAPRLDTARLGGIELPTFSREDQLLILCIHGSRHRWSRLEWICAVAELLRASGEIDGSALLQRAATLGGRRMLLLGLFLAHTLLGAPIPADVKETAGSDRAVARLTRRVHQILAGEDVAHGEPRQRAGGALWFRVGLQDSLPDKARVLAYHLTTPGVGEWRILSFAGGYLPLHAFYRPLDLLVKAGGRAYRRLLRRGRRPAPRSSGR